MLKMGKRREKRGDRTHFLLLPPSIVLDGSQRRVQVQQKRNKGRWYPLTFSKPEQTCLSILLLTSGSPCAFLTSPAPPCMHYSFLNVFLQIVIQSKPMADRKQTARTRLKATVYYTYASIIFFLTQTRLFHDQWYDGNALSPSRKDKYKYHLFPPLSSFFLSFSFHQTTITSPSHPTLEFVMEGIFTNQPTPIVW